MSALQRLWSRRPLRWLIVFATLLALVGAGRVGQVAWESFYFGARGPYLQVLTPHSVIIRWQSDTASAARVRYGLRAEQLDQQAGSGETGRAQAVTLSNLQPATRYFYAIGDGAPNAFVTPPPAGSAVPVRFWAFGDSGKWGEGQDAMRAAALRWMADHPRGDRPLFDFGLALGDNAYTSGTNPQYQQAYFGPFDAILRSYMIWPLYGNHDARRGAYFRVFTLPEQGEAGGVASGSAHWYSFDHGPVHVVVLDSEGSDRAPGGPMLTWLRADLQATQQPWLVAAFHHPPYTKGSHDSDNARDSGARMQQMRENALPLLEAAGVDLVLSGHSHDYERSHLIDCHYGPSASLTPAMVLERGADLHKPSAGRAPHEGTVYVVDGASSKDDAGPLNHPVMAQSAARLGSLVVDVAGTRLDARYVTSSGEVLDSFTLVKGAGETYRRPSSCGK